MARKTRTREAKIKRKGGRGRGGRGGVVEGGKTQKSKPKKSSAAKAAAKTKRGGAVRSGSESRSRPGVRVSRAGNRAKVTMAGEFMEPETKQEGEVFEATTAPVDKDAKDVSQDMHEQALTAPRDGAEKENSTAGTE